jgi:uncharacterized membrane protein (TIGR02234 family)
MTRATGANASRDPARRTRLLAVGASALGGALALIGSSLTWVTVTAAAEGLPRIRVEASGRDLLPLVPAAAILALGAALALALVRGWGRRAVAATVLVVEIYALVEVLGLILDEAAAGRSAFELAGGAADALRADTLVELSPTAWLAVLGLVAAAAGQTVALLARSWPGGGRRFERAEPVAPPSRDDAVAMWDALDRGEDPTG